MAQRRTESSIAEQFAQALKFVAWPSACGILIALVLVQYQQIERLSYEISRVNQPPSSTQNGAPSELEASQPVNSESQLRYSFKEAIALAAPAVVSISATSFNVAGVESASDDSVNFLLGERASLGSGVILSEQGFIITNLHVVDSLFNAFDTTVTLNDGRSAPATVIGWDQSSDLAVLHINMDGLVPVKHGDDSRLNVGDVVLAIGYPRNIGQSVSQGIVSALITTDRQNNSGQLSPQQPYIQTDAAINPGNSGGALINPAGELVGINSAIISESGNSEGLSFATPVSLVLEILDDLVNTAVEQNPGYLGVIAGELLTEQSSQLFFGIPHIRGMLVESVDEGGPAQRAGIEPGDVLTEVDGTQVQSEQSVIAAIQQKKPGQPIAVQVYRNGQIFNLTVTLGFGQAIVIGA